MPGNKTEFEYSANLTEEEFQEHPIINWDGIIWVNRPLYLWIVQVILAMISFTEAILLAYLGYKVRTILKFWVKHKLVHNIFIFIEYYAFTTIILIIYLL